MFWWSASACWVLLASRMPLWLLVGDVHSAGNDSRRGKEPSTCRLTGVCFVPE